MRRGHEEGDRKGGKDRGNKGERKEEEEREEEEGEEKKSQSQAWWHIPAIPESGKLKQN